MIKAMCSVCYSNHAYIFPVEPTKLHAYFIRFTCPSTSKIALYWVSCMGKA